jgi:hypothetical protein
MEETTDLLSQAIKSIRTKNAPPSVRETTSEPHALLYPLLEVWQPDPETEERTKFIHDFLTDEQGTARDKIMHILTELPPISNETTLNRIWKYCRLKNEYRNTIKRAEILNKRMKNI